MPTHQLLFGSTLWGFIGLVDPLKSAIPGLASNGYRVLETGTGEWNKDPEILDLCRQHNMQPVIQCYPSQVNDLLPVLEQANAIGALMVNAHAANAHMSADATAELVSGFYEQADKANVRLVLETHRGRLTQDLYRTAQLCERVPRVQFNLDVSHFIVCEERPGPTADLEPWLRPVMERAQMIHGRISNGQQVQVGVGDGSGELPQRTMHFWAETMRLWRTKARPGSAFIFTPELGPPDYAIRGNDGKELTDRIQQSQVIRQLAQQAWDLAMKATDPLWPVS